MTQHIRPTLQDFPPLGVGKQADGGFLVGTGGGTPSISAFFARYLYFVASFVVSMEPFAPFREHRAQWVALFPCQELLFEYSWAIFGKVYPDNESRVGPARKIPPLVLVCGEKIVLSVP